MASDDGGLHASPFGSLGELRAVQTQLGELRRRDSESRALWDAVDEFVWRGAATGAILDGDDERWSVQGVLDYWATALERAGRPRRDSALAAFDPDAAPVLPDQACPYLGVDAFQEADAEVFFGRDALIDELVARVGERRLVAVVGPAGAGKTSLVLAGALPRLRKGALAGSDGWQVLRLAPGVAPRAALARLLAEHSLGEASPALLVVDPFEELFSACASETERAAFIDDLLALATAPSPQHRVVLVVRSQFESVIARYPALRDHCASGRVAVVPPSARELRRAIEGPGAAIGLTLSPDLIDRLIPELVGEPASLPLLQLTLRLLWHRRDRNRITEAGCEQVGAGRRALADIADESYQALGDEDRITARRLLLITGIASTEGDPPATRVPRARMFEAGGEAADIERVLDHLLRAQLLRRVVSRDGAEPQIELVHEALAHNWPPLVTWLQDARISLGQQRRLEARATEWSLLGRGRGAVLDDVQLHDAEQWQASAADSGVRASDDVVALLDHSRRHLRALAWRRRATRVGLASLGVALAAAVAVVVVRDPAPRFARPAAASPTRDRLPSAGDQLPSAGAALAPLAASAVANLEQGRALLLDGALPRPMRALPYLLAARSAGIDSPVLRLLFAQASRTAPLVTLTGHASSIAQVAFSLDGKRIVTASDDMTARIWDPASGQAAAPPLQHAARVTAAAFSPDGTRLVTASNMTAQIWDTTTGQRATRPLEQYGHIAVATYSPDGTRVVTAGDDHMARIWDARTGKPVGMPITHQGAIVAAAFSPDGTRVVTASDDHTARVWDARTGTPVTPPLVHRAAVTAAGFGLDGLIVVTGCADGAARLWDARTGTPLGVPVEHQAAVVAAQLRRDGLRLVTASEDHTARVWDIMTGRPVTPPLEHGGGVTSVAFSPDGTQIATTSTDRTARVWDAATGRPITPPLEHLGSVTSAAFSPDGARIATAGKDGTARIWSVRAGIPSPLHIEQPGAILAAAFSPDGTRIATAGKDGTARIWDARAGAQIAALDHQGPVASVGFSRDGARLVTASWDHTARIWDARTGKPLGPSLVHRAEVLAATFSPDGTRVATASKDRTARVWDTRTGAAVTPPLEYSELVSSVAFDPDGARLVAASWDGTARIRDARTGTPVTPSLEHHGPIASAAFSRDGARLVTASWDRTARIWDARTGTPAAPPLEHHGSVASAAFSPDGTRVITASDDATAQLWDARTGRPLAAPFEYQRFVAAAEFSADSTRVIAASWDGTARIWDVATGKPLTPALPHGGPVTAAAFSPDGTRVLTVSDDGAAWVWDLPVDRGSLDDWRARASCSPFVLDGVLTANRAPRTPCPRPAQ